MKQSMAIRMRRGLCMALILALLLAFVPINAAAADRIEANTEITGVLTGERGVVTYALPAQGSGPYMLGLILTVTPDDGSFVELNVEERRGDETFASYYFTNDVADESEYVTVSGSTATLQILPQYRAAGGCEITISCPDYQWMADNGESLRDLKLAYTLQIVVEEWTLGAKDFRDVMPDDWFYDAVDFAVTKGLFQGVDEVSFDPNTSMTRAMFVTVLGRRAGIDQNAFSGGSGFSDVADTAYYAPYVRWASGLGIVTGIGGGQFGPDQPLTRQDLVVMLHRYVSAVGGDATGTASLIGFSDFGYIASYALLPLQWAVNRGIISGMGDNQLDPRGYATRAQVAKIFMGADGLLDYVAPEKPVAEPEEDSFTQVNDLLGKQIEAAIADGQLTDEAFAALLDYTRSLEAEGLITEVETVEDGLFFTTADGIPSGIVLRCEESEDGEALLGGNGTAALTQVPFTQAENANILAATVNGKLYLENNKILVISSFANGDRKYYEPLRPAFAKLREKGYEVKEVTSAGVEDFAALADGDYGMIILVAHGAVRGDEFYLATGEMLRKDDPKLDQLRRSNWGRVLHQVKNSSGTTVIGYEVAWSLPSQFFRSLLESKPLNNSYVHLIACQGMKNNRMAQALTAGGAQTVTGYSDFVQMTYAANALNALATVIQPAGRTDSSVVSAQELCHIVMNDFGYNQFQLYRLIPGTGYEALVVAKTELTAAGSGAMLLATPPQEIPAAAEGIVAFTSGVAKLSRSFGSGMNVTNAYQVQATLTNDTDEEVGAVRYRITMNGRVGETKLSTFRPTIAAGSHASMSFSLSLEETLTDCKLEVLAYAPPDDGSGYTWREYPADEIPMLSCTFE